MSTRLLVAEDDPEIQRVVRLALKKAGFEVTAVNDGREALSRAAADRPDVILLDWMMPGLDGPTTCARLKEDPATRHIPVIFMTARSQEAEIQRGLGLGAAGYILKPFDALTLGSQVRAILEK